MTDLDTLPKIVVVCGPTAAGKTGFGIELSRLFAGEVVGADSMQIYRYMDIGTAKPTPEERAAVAHHMVDIVDPDEPFDAAAYRRLAARKVADILDRGKAAFVVGGTGLYIKSLVYGIFSGQPQTDPDLRTRLHEEAARYGSAGLHRKLAGIDAPAAARIHPNDTYRIIRALEVLELTGQGISDHHRGHGFRQPLYNALYIGLTLPRELLYDRIDRRVDMMLAQGLEGEVGDLLRRGYGPELKAMQSLGYRHMVDFVQGKSDRRYTMETLKRDHRRYAKRQLTWFRAIPAVKWLQQDDLLEAVRLVKSFLG